MYCTTNFKTKKALKEAVAQGKYVGVTEAGIGDPPPVNGEVSVEGPQYAPHTWYARVTLENGKIVKVK